MAFIQPCFIRKITPELIKELEKLGYFYTYYHHGSGIYCYNNIAQPFTYNMQIPKECIGVPQNNEELFLALAALRDDSDYMQWFICDDNESMFKVDKPYMSMSKFIHEYMDGWNVSGARKATIKEIIEHFKNK